MVTCIIRVKKINLPYIILERFIKILSKDTYSLIYSNMFTNLLERKRVKLTNETEKTPMRTIYDIYIKKILGIMHLVKRDGT